MQAEDLIPIIPAVMVVLIALIPWYENRKASAEDERSSENNTDKGN